MARQGEMIGQEMASAFERVSGRWGIVVADGMYVVVERLRDGGLGYPVSDSGGTYGTSSRRVAEDVCREFARRDWHRRSTHAD